MILAVTSGCVASPPFADADAHLDSSDPFIVLDDGTEREKVYPLKLDSGQHRVRVALTYVASGPGMIGLEEKGGPDLEIMSIEGKGTATLTNWTYGVLDSGPYQVFVLEPQGPIEFTMGFYWS